MGSIKELLWDRNTLFDNQGEAVVGLELAHPQAETREEVLERHLHITDHDSGLGRAALSRGRFRDSTHEACEA